MAVFQKTISDEVRRAVLEDYISGMTHAKIAQKYGIGQSSVGRIVLELQTSRENAAPGVKVRSIRQDFATEWNRARSRVLGLRPGWIDEWNEAREALLKGAN